MIEIQNWRDCSSSEGKPIIALFDVYLPKISLTLREFRIVRKKKGGFFIKGPSFQIKGRDSASTWMPYFSFNGEREKEFFEKIYELVKDSVKL